MLFGAKAFKRTLKTSTALVAVAMLAAPGNAGATAYVVDGGNSPVTTITLAAGDTLSVASGASVTSGVVVNGGVAGSIDNSGSILSLGGGALRVLAGSAVSGGITNEHDGILYASSAGISAAGTITGGIINSGEIGAGIKAIHVQGGSIDSITNESGGYITAGSIAISVGGGTLGSINNSGSISGNFTGIQVSNGGSIGAIDNSGNISGFAGIAASNGSNSTIDSITNESGGSLFGTYSGIYVSGGASLGAIINKSGGGISGNNSGIYVSIGTIDSITNESGGSISGSSAAISIGTHGGSIGAIDNSGLIAGNGQGIKVRGGGSIASITNESGAEIGATNITGIYINSGTIGAIENSGTIFGGYYASIYLGVDSTIDSLTNESTGVISTGESGIYNSGGMIHSLTNESGGTISGNYTGIHVTNSGSIGAIDNSGQISGGVAGIMARNSTIDSLTNESGGNLSGVSFAISIMTNGSIGSIDNSGQILGGTTEIRVQGGGSIDALTNESGAEIGQAGVTSIYINNGTLGAIDNKGAIFGGYYGAIYLGAAGTIDSLTNESGGVISTGTAGIYNTGGTIGSLTNESGGTLSGSVTGIHVTNSGSIGAIDNSGIISGGSNGIYVSNGTIDSITNESSGNISGFNTGLTAGAGASIGAIDNSGTISGSYHGVKAYDSTIDSITNESGGAISGSSTGAIAINNGRIGAIDNSGVISKGYMGIYMTGSSSVGAIDNSGTILGNFYGIFVNSSTIDSITNESGGIISGGSTYGIYVRSNGSIGAIDNSGTIYGFHNGINVSGGASIGAITNESGGTIQGDLGAITYSGLTAPTSLVIKGGSIIGDVTDGAITPTYSAVAVAGDFTTGGNFTVASFDIAAGKTLETGNTITTQTLTTHGGILTFGVTSSADHGSIVIKNGAATLTGETITVDVNTANTLGVGDIFKIIDGTTNLVGGPGGTPITIDDNSPILKFQMVDGTGAGIGDNATDLYLKVLHESNITISTPYTRAISLLTGDALTVTNTGSIDGFITYGVLATNGVVSSIDNSGIIRATYSGIYIVGSGSIGVIDNSGLIAASYAISVMGGGSIGSIDNSGSILGSRLGMYIANGTIDSITNESGGIFSDISMLSNGLIGAIDNYGSFSNITVSDATIDSITNESGGTFSSSISVLNDGLIGAIDNYGGLSGITTSGSTINSITNESGGVISSLYGINAGGTIDSITNESGATISGSFGIFVANGGSIGTIDNSGVISANLGIYTSSGGSIGAITNESGATIWGIGGPAISYNGLSAPTALVINGGAIVGDVTDNAVTPTYSAVTIAGDFTTQGNFTVASFDIAAGKTLEVSSANTINTQTLTTHGSGTLTFGVTSTALHGEIVIANGAANLTGETITVDVDPSNTLASSDKILLIDGSANIIGGPGATPLTVDSNSPFFTFQIVNGTGAGIGDATDLYLLTTRLSDIVVSTHYSGQIPLIDGNTLTVTNTGAISNTNTAVLISATSANIGSIDNSGTIAGSQYGIVNNGTIASLTNESAGTISGTGSPAILVNGGLIGSLYNSGTILSGYHLAPAISITNGGTITNLVNESTGTISGNNSGGGIYLAGSSIGNIDNSGVISGYSYAISLNSASTISGGIDNSGSIINAYTGIVVAHGSTLDSVTNESGGYMSSIYGDLYINGNITDITNESGGRMVGNTVIRVGSGTISGTLTNSGVIAGNNYGIFASGSNDLINRIVNTDSGTISGAAFTAIVNQTGGTISGGIDNSGLITGAKAITVNTAAITGGITNESTGTIYGIGGTAIALNKLTAATPILINGGRIIGNVTDDTIASGFSQVTIGGDFTTEGDFDVSSLTVNSGKTLEISTANTVTTHTLAINGSTLTFGITSTANHGEIIIENGAADLNGGTITVDVATVNTLSAGDRILIVDGSANLLNGPGAVPKIVTDNAAAWNFEIVDGTYGDIGGDATQLYLEVFAAPGVVTVDTATTSPQVMVDDETLLVTNTGAITGVATGILVNPGVSANSIDNSGTISGTTRGIYLDNSTIGGITNKSGATIEGATDGVSLDFSAHLTGAIDNSGLITGITAYNGSSIDSVTNESGGFISGNGSAAILSGNGARIGDIDNSGIITGNLRGIRAVSNGTIDSINNESNATIAATASNGVGISMFNGGFGPGIVTGSITNHGLITGATGILISGTGSQLTGGLTNESGATIEGTSGTAISLNNLTAATPITINGGAILGAITDTAATPTYSAVTIANNFTTAGNITVAAVTIASNKTLEISTNNTITTQTLTTNTGILTFGVTSAADHGAITIANGSLNLTGETITIDVATLNTLADGDKFLLIDGASAITGGPGSTPLTVTDNAADWIFQIVDGTAPGIGADATDLYLEVFAAPASVTISTPTAGFALASNESLVVTNTGTITGLSTALTVNTGIAAGNVDNSGTITANGGAGIYVNGGAIASGVTNESTGLIAGTNYAIAIGNAGTIGGIANHGTITGGQTALYVYNNSNISSGLDNSGTITAPTAIAISNSAITGGITNESTGTINGDIAFTALTSSTPLIINGGAINGNVTDDTPGANRSPVTIAGNFTTNGNFSVSSFDIAATKSLGISTNNTITTRTLATHGGTLTFGVTSAATHGEIIITNGTADLTNETITVNVANNNTLAAGDKILIIDANTNLIGGPGATATTVTDNAAAWNFKIIDGTGDGIGTDATNLYLEVSAAPAAAATIATTPNNQQAATALTAATTTSNPTLTQIAANLTNAPTPAAANHILESIQPTVDQSTAAAAAAIAASTISLIDNRLSSLRANTNDITASDTATQTGLAAGNPTYGLNAWAQAFGEHTAQQTRQSIAGYTANSWGAAAGLDTQNLSDRMTVGLAFSYGQTHANSNNANTTATDVDSYQASLYGNYALDNRTYINALAAYGWNENQTTRHNIGGINTLNANAKFHSTQITTQAELGRDYNAANTILRNSLLGTATLTPDALIHWVNYTPESYTETGAGGANLRVDGNTMNLLEAGLGAKAAWILHNATGSTIIPELRAGYRYALINDRIQDASTFTGNTGSPTFLTQGPTPPRNGFSLGTTLKLNTPTNWQLTASYDFTYKSNYTDSAAFVRAGYKF